MAVLFSSHLLFPFLLYLVSFTSSASSDDQLLSSMAASKQIKFWSENVKNKMPISISTRLSPLIKQDSEYYSKAISRNNFKADTRFCSLAKLACSINEGITITPQGGAQFAFYGQTKPNQAKIFDEFKNSITPQGGDKFAFYGQTTPNQELKKGTGTVPVEHVDQFTFFRLSNLREGYTIHLPNVTQTQSFPFRAFLPAEIAKKISLSPKLLTSIFPDTPKEAIVSTVSICAATAQKGEVKACPKSLEEMIAFSKTALNTSKLLALTTKSIGSSGEEVIVGKSQRLNAEKMVACHEMFLPFATYYCHSLSSSRIYAMELVEPKTRAPMYTAMAVCHMDTSTWSENHVAFKTLKFKPGQAEVCHWMDETGLAWINAAGKNI